MMNLYGIKYPVIHYFYATFNKQLIIRFLKEKIMDLASYFSSWHKISFIVNCNIEFPKKYHQFLGAFAGTNLTRL